MRFYLVNLLIYHKGYNECNRYTLFCIKINDTLLDELFLYPHVVCELGKTKPDLENK